MGLLQVHTVLDFSPLIPVTNHRTLFPKIILKVPVLLWVRIRSIGDLLDPDPHGECGLESVKIEHLNYFF